jgi:cytochrome P450
VAEAPGSFFAAETLEDPHPFFAWLRREAPVWRVPETGHWLVSRYEDVRRVCQDPETFTARLGAVVTRDETGAVRLLDIGIADTPHGSVLGVADGAPHTRHRQSVGRAFSPRRMRELEEAARAIATECVEACLRARDVDLVRDLARPIPRRLMAVLLGLPLADEERIEAWSDGQISLMGGLPAREQLERAAAGSVEFLAYLGEHLDRALREPGPGVIGDLARLVRGEAEPELSRTEAHGILVHLVVGGNETTVGLIAAAARFVAELPGMWERLRASPDEIPAFVEEALRLETPAHGNYRRTTRAVELGGVPLPEGATLAMLWGSANRDESEFPDADRFVMHRPNIKGHLGFGHGAHFCLGSALARLETRVALEVLFERASSVRIRRPGALRHVPSVFIRRLASLEAEVA